MMKQALTVNMHVADIKRAHSAADRLGMEFEEFVLLCAHLIGAAVLEGRKALEVPAESGFQGQRGSAFYARKAPNLLTVD